MTGASAGIGRAVARAFGEERARVALIARTREPLEASEAQGPTVVRQLEPAGFLALHYGRRTPISVLLAHLAFGAILGGLYRP